MAVVSMKALLESGVHFGHRTNKWNPRMKPYIFTERNGIHIIDLQQTVKAVTNAYNAVRDSVAHGGMVMFVGTKRQAQETVHDEAIRCGMPYVTERWLGGMLTNWSTIHQRIVELERMEKLFSSGEIEKLTKKEALLIQREITRLNINLSGVRNMVRLPDLVFVVDVSREYAAVHESNLLNIPVIALVDTNCDPSNVDYVIPSNDDAIRAIKLLVAKMADAAEEGRALRKDELLEAEAVKARFAESTPEAIRRTGQTIETEEELQDEELLGESTLAKLIPAVEVAEAPAVEVAEVPEVEVAEVPAVEVAEVPAVEVAEAPAVEVAETPAKEDPKKLTGTKETKKKKASEVEEKG